MLLTRSFFALSCLCLLFSSTALLAGEDAAVPSRTEIVVSVAEQKLALIRDGEVLRKYPISTSRFGIGDAYGSYRTPLGRLKIGEKIGDGLPQGAVIHHRNFTGEILKPNAPGRDPIVSRILWLNGMEPSNANAYSRCVYIHGTPDEKHLGRPASYGCIRMRSTDVIELYGSVSIGTDVSIIPGKLPGGAPSHPLFARFASAATDAHVRL